MNRKMRLFAVLALVTVVFASAYAAAPGRLATVDPQIARISLGSVATIDPTMYSFANDLTVIQAMFEGLLRINPVTKVTEPGLAESWVTSPDLQTYTVTLKTGLTWSDGTPITAEDVRFSILRAIHPDTQAPLGSYLFPILNAQAYNSGAITDPDEVGVHVLNATQIEFDLEYPMSFFEKLLTVPLAGPLPKAVIEAHPDDWLDPQYLVVSGAYKLVEWTGEHILVERNPLYYDNDIMNLDGLEFVFSPDPFQAYLTGRVDSISSGIDMGAVQADPVLMDELTISMGGACTFGVSFRDDYAPFDQPLVRKAFISALDRHGFETTNPPMGLATQTFIPPSIFGYVDGPALGIGLPSDPAAAAQYLTDAGYPDGTGFPAISIAVRESVTNQARWAILEAGWEAALNIDITVNFVDSTTYSTMLNNGEIPITFAGWCADYLEGYNFLFNYVDYARSIYLGDWYNQDYEDLRTLAGQTSDPDARKLVYQQAEEILVETDAIYGPLYNNYSYDLTKPYLTRSHAGSSDMYYFLWSMDKTGTTMVESSSEVVIEPDVDEVSYIFPANTFEQDVNFDHQVLEEFVYNPPGTNPFGISFGDSVVPAAGAKTGLATYGTLTPCNPYTLQVGYSQFQVDAYQVDESTLGLYYLDENGVWQKEPTAVLDADANTITAEPAFIASRWGVFGDNPNAVFIPVLTK